MAPNVVDLDLSAMSLPGLTRQSSIVIRRLPLSMDARVKPAHDKSMFGVSGVRSQR
jgi:hypothetical protein